MAVTVANAAPSTTVKRAFQGSYGTLASAVTADPGSDLFSKHRVKLTQLSLSGTYITNGFALTPSAYGLKEIQMLAVVADGNSGGVAVPFLSTTGVSPIVKLVVDKTPTELANATSVTNHQYTVLLIGY